jgi:hypothetical protein
VIQGTSPIYPKSSILTTVAEIPIISLLPILPTNPPLRLLLLVAALTLVGLRSTSLLLTLVLDRRRSGRLYRPSAVGRWELEALRGPAPTVSDLHTSTA